MNVGVVFALTSKYYHVYFKVLLGARHAQTVKSLTEVNRDHINILNYGGDVSIQKRAQNTAFITSYTLFFVTKLRILPSLLALCP